LSRLLTIFIIYKKKNTKKQRYSGRKNNRKPQTGNICSFIVFLAKEEVVDERSSVLLLAKSTPYPNAVAVGE
jgi:hypothetical protein